jgi:hypothetical protein
MMTLRIQLSHYGDQETGHNEFPYFFSLSSVSSGRPLAYSWAEGPPGFRGSSLSADRLPRAYLVA